MVGPAFLRTLSISLFILGGHWIKVAFLTSSELHNSLKLHQHEQMRTTMPTWQAGKNKPKGNMNIQTASKPTISIRGEKCFLHCLSNCFRRCGLNQVDSRAGELLCTHLLATLLEHRVTAEGHIHGFEFLLYYGVAWRFFHLLASVAVPSPPSLIPADTSQMCPFC